MSDTIIDGTKFNVNDIIYTSPKANPIGGKCVNILNKHTKTSLTLSTPLMLTWGASDYVDEKTGLGNGKFEMSLQFPSEEHKTEDTDAFFTNMLAFQNKVKTDALEKSKEWFGKVHKSADIIDELFSPMLKYPNQKGSREPDYTKTPALKIKIRRWEGVWKCEIYDEDNEPLFPSSSNSNVSPLDYLKKFTTVALIIQFAGIWFVNGKFSISWNLVQAVVQKPRATLTGKCFIQLKKADKEKLKAAAPPPTEDDNDNNIQATIVDDSEDEDTDTPTHAKKNAGVELVVECAPASSQEEEEVVAPAVVFTELKKKVVSKRK
jgi:hypothetical protein